MNDESQIRDELARQHAMVEEHHRLIRGLRRRLVLERVVFIGFIAVLLVVIWRIAGPRQPAVIQVNGKHLATVASKRVAEEVIAWVMREQAGEAAPFARFREKVTVVPVPPRSAGRIMPANEARAKLAERAEAIVRGYGVYVDGRLGAVLPTKKQAERTGQEAQIKFARRGSQRLTTSFRESVTFKPVTVKPNQVVLSTRAAVDELTKPRGKPRMYVVKAGDTAWQIADRHGLTLEDLERQNPGRDLNHIRIDEELSLGPAKPMLTVVAVEERRIVKRIPHRVVAIPTTDIAGGRRKVIQEGRDGQEVSIVRNTYHNGLLVKEELISKQIEQAPVAEKVLVGR